MPKVSRRASARRSVTFGRAGTAVLVLSSLLTVVAGLPGGGAAGASTDVAVGFGGNEPHTAVVNPLNPNNVVVSQATKLAISTDFGATFPTTINVPAAPATPSANQAWSVCGDDVLAFDDQGHLFWSYLRCLNDTSVVPSVRIDISLFVQQIDPTNGTTVNNEVEVTPGLHSDDKQWIAADANPASPFAGNLYLHWTRFDVSPSSSFFSRSTDGGLTWSAPIAVPAGAGEGFTHQTNAAVAPNGDVYLSYHTNTCGAANLGRIRVIRDSTGGANLAAGTATQATYAFAAGQAAVTCNRQPQPGAVPGADFLMQGSAAGYVVPDTVRPGTVYVITNDDPNDTYGNGDDGDVVMARSTDYGLTWAAPVRIDHAPAGTLQVFPTAAIDQDGKLAVMWWDTRGGQTGSAGNFLLDMYMTFSRDGGQTWTNDVRINDVAFDPDGGNTSNFGNPADSPPTRRIGEYNGLAAANGVAYTAFTGNTFSGTTPTGLRILFDVVSIDGAFADRFEPNDARQAGVATDLGARATYNESGLTISRPTDEDFFKVTALASGRMDVQIGSNARFSDLDVQVLDRNGSVVATRTSGADTNSTETITFPAVAGEPYVVRVYADPGGLSPTQFPTLNTYSLNVVNVAAPTPTGIALAPGSDTGASSTDNVTSNAQPALLVRVDTTTLGSVPFSVGTSPSSDSPGYKVATYSNGVLLGYAQPIGGGIFSLTPTAALSDGLNFITTLVVIVDPRMPTPHAVGFGAESAALQVRIVTGAPATLGPPDLIAAADSGGIDDDNVTTLTTPTFVGTASPNAVVRLYANGVQVGEGTASSTTGDYRITVGPLTDGAYQITARQEDMAGNLSAPSSGLKVTIANQRLTLPGLTAAQGVGPVTIDLGAGTVAGYAGVLGVTGKVGIVGIPQVNLDTGGRPVSVVGSTGDDQITYRPSGAASGELFRLGVAQVIVVSNTSSLALDPLGGNDTVTVVATNNADSITANVDTTAVTRVGSTLALATNTASTERLAIMSLLGADTVSVTTRNTVNANVFVDEADPAANTPKGDLLQIIDGSGSGQLQNGPGGAVAGSGSFIMTYPKTTLNKTRIDYAGVEKIVKR